MKKLSKEDVEKKAKHHKKRAEFYNKKLNELKKDENKIGFKFY